MHASRARAVFLLLYGALLAWQIDRWLFTPHGLASTWHAPANGVPISAGSPAGLSQTFTMGADGLDGVWLRPGTGDVVPEGQLVVDLSAIHDEAPIRIERVAVAAADAVRGRWLHVPFHVVRHSRGQSYRIDIRHVGVARGPAIEFLTTRDDTLRPGRLFADGQERWGDLAFETSSRRATLPYWIHEVLRPWPAWVSSWPAIVLALAIFNAVLAWACARAVGLGEPPDAPALDTGSGRVSVASAALTATTIVAVVGVAMAARPVGRYRSLDLIEALPEARIETTWPALHDAVVPGPAVFQNHVHRAIIAMPTTSIAWTIDVPQGAILRMGAAMRADMWEKESDGIQMEVAVEHGGARTVLTELTLFTMGVPGHRRLMPIEVPLHAWAGQRVTLVLRSTPERWGNAVNDVPVWTEPRIEWPRNPAAGTATVVRKGM